MLAHYGEGTMDWATAESGHPRAVWQWRAPKLLDKGGRKWEDGSEKKVKDSRENIAFLKKLLALYLQQNPSSIKF